MTELALALPLMPVTMNEIPGPETASKRKLIAAGERLLGLKGFGGVALQEIASTAGQANKYAVQYHFGDLDGLIRAIFAIRLRWIHERRAILLDRARSLGLMDDIDALLEALFVPLAEQIDADGHHSYARFWLQYIARPGYDATNDTLFSISGTPAEQLFVHLADALQIAGSMAHDRFGVQFSVLTYALIDRDNRRNRGENPALDLVLVRAIRSVAAALKADLPRFPSNPG